MVFPTLLTRLANAIPPVRRRQFEYVLAENYVYRASFRRDKRRPKLTDRQRRLLALKAHSLGWLVSALATLATAKTLRRWYRDLVEKPVAGRASAAAKAGRPSVSPEVEKLILRFAEENPRWGYERIVGALRNLGHELCPQTVANVLAKHGVLPAPERRKQHTWKRFLKQHFAALWATDFFTVPVWTLRGRVMVYVLFFLQLQTRRVVVAGFNAKPNEPWILKVTRKALRQHSTLRHARYLIRDRDGKFPASFDALLKTEQIEPVVLPPRSPNLNAYAERFVRSIKEECLDHWLFLGERSLQRALTEYLAHYHHERHHQGLDNTIPFGGPGPPARAGPMRKRSRLGGLLNYYYRKAA
jgi:transposase InsO family protein